MRFRNVDIEINQSGSGAVIVDGTDIARSVIGLTVSGGVNQRTTVTLTLNVRKSARFTGLAKVVLSRETMNLLESLGWTPPSDDGAGLEAVLTEGGDV